MSYFPDCHPEHRLRQNSDECVLQSGWTLSARRATTMEPNHSVATHPRSHSTIRCWSSEVLPGVSFCLCERNVLFVVYGLPSSVGAKVEVFFSKVGRNRKHAGWIVSEGASCSPVLCSLEWHCDLLNFPSETRLHPTDMAATSPANSAAEVVVIWLRSFCTWI